MIGQHILEDSQGVVRQHCLTTLLRAVFPRFLAGAMAVLFLLLCGPAAAQESELALQLQRVRRDLSDLQAYIYSGKAPSREAIADIQTGSSDSTARLQVQLQDLESQVRTLTGRVEEIENGINRVTERVEKLVADVDIRFQALEGTNRNGAAPGGAGAPAGTGQRSDQRSLTSATQVASASGQPVDDPKGAPSAKGLEVGQQVLGTMSQTGAQVVKPPLQTLPEGVDGSPAPSGGKQVAKATGGNPRERYDAAFQYLQQRDYDKAATSFDSFVKENPNSPLSSNALYWLGETHYFRKDYAEAARVFLDGYKRYPKGTKAPDNLFKLGKSLAAINEKKPACAAWSKLLKSYPDANKRLLGNAKSEMSKLSCS